MTGGFLEKLGDGRSTRYAATDAAKAAISGGPSAAPLAVGPGQLRWSSATLPLIEALRAPLGTRTPVGYESNFVGSYIPNQSSLLPPRLATELFNAGRSRDQLPAGTYVREVLEQLLIDLSWSSSRLEGNNKSLLDTKALFEHAEQEGPLDEDTLMLLNHKNAIEFMVDAVPTESITVPVIVDLTVLAWSRWRRRHQAQAMGCHYRALSELSTTVVLERLTQPLVRRCFALPCYLHCLQRSA